jgi:histidyl-tRNA synthetase
MAAKTQPARGMRDFLPADVRRREYVISVVREVYERYGFEPLETPAVENIETLLGKYGEEGNQLIFKILKRGEHEKTGEADLALRYDLTVPLARVVAEYGDKLPKFFKRYQIQPVWRADRPARGRFREFYQCDVDICGSRSMIVEAELCAAVSDVLVKLGFNDFIIRLNHRQVLAGMLEVAGIPSNRHNDALVTIDKLDKIGPEGIEKELAEKGFHSPNIPALLEFLSFSREDANRRQHKIGVLHRMANFLNDASPERQQGHYELAKIELLTRSNSASQYIRFDASLARGLSYYTGTIMEVNVPDLSGSLGGGGRYDNLVGMFSGRDIPACGFSLGLERIIVVMTEREMFPSYLIETSADVMVTIWNEESVAESLQLAHELRALKLRVSVYPESGDKLGKQFKYASALGLPFVVIIGPEEKARGEVAIKNMLTGDQNNVPRDQVADWIRETLV